MPDLNVLYELFLRSGSVTTDSRLVKPGDLFFGLRGEQFNGNRFAPDAIAKGAACAVVDDETATGGEKTLLVKDSLATLQALAALHRKRVKAKIIAITGSNGKTTTKELISIVLSSRYRTIATTGNLNNHIGVPLTLLSIKNNTEFAVVEMGANHQGEISALCQVADPDYGIITNIGKAHLEGFGGPLGVIKAKSGLYHYLRSKKGLAFVNCDNDLLMELSEGIERICYGKKSSAGCVGTFIKSQKGLILDCRFGNLKIEGARSNLIGDYNFENLLAAVCIGAWFQVDPAGIKEALENYIPQNNRSQILETGRNKLILDAYNANPSSMKAALENFSDLHSGHKIAILGDMMELGDYSTEEHLQIARQAGELKLDKVIFVGSNFCNAVKNDQLLCFRDTDSAAAWLGRQNLKGFLVLLKGSRKMQLEKLIPLL
jgi:UDP-N-acetylmuramoyl-tripeptide--D-alanyl-D-alanine ligase